MPEPRTCEARQYNDQMHCARCNVTWDVNDSDPPVCPLERTDGRATLDNLLNMLREDNTNGPTDKTGSTT